MSALSLAGRHKNELPTPRLLLDLDALDRNIEKMADCAAGLPCDLRPHMKTHKSLLIAHKQIRAGAIGITCAKIEDARAFACGGINNILIANEIVDPDKIRELAGLAQFVKIMVCVDHYENAEQLSAAALEQGARIDVLVEVEVGVDRCGVQPGEPCVELVRRISPLTGIHFRGLMGYEGALYGLAKADRAEECHKRNRMLVDSAAMVQEADFPVEIVSAGGSNTWAITGKCAGITELQVGSYATMDTWNYKEGIDFEQSVTVLSTVISLPRKNRAITDTGLKAISLDHGPIVCLSHANLKPDQFNEEHGRFDIVGQEPAIKVGDRIELAPSHGCTTIPLFTSYALIKGDRCVGEAPLISGSAVY